MAEENGEAWLGKINLYDEDKGKPILWKWDGSLVRNFSCAFVIPAYDANLERMIRERDESEYTGCRDDLRRIRDINRRIDNLGGVNLVWT
jgi:hypothetical protein